MTAAEAVTVGSVTVLPPAPTEDAFTTVCQDEAALRPGVERLGRQLGMDVSRLTRYASGSRPVYASGDLVLKLFPPVDLAGCRLEAGVLAAVRGQLPTPVPRVHATGEHDGWGYVLMSRLPGVALDTVWDRVSARERDVLASQLGETLATLHQLPPPRIPGWWPADWPGFVARRRAYGYGRDQLGPELHRRLLAWGILHRYSNLAGWLQRLPRPSEPTLGALAGRWFATE